MKLCFPVMILLSVLCVCVWSSAQQSTQAPAPAPPDPEQEKEIQKKEQSQRMIVIPQFAVTNRKAPPPLTPGGKFHLFFKSAFDPVTFAVTGAQAGISQANDEFPEYGQGAAGYGKRYGATFADQVSSGFFSDFVYTSLLKLDPRYFRMGEGPFKRRVGYALAQAFVIRKDAGGRTFNWSNALGAITSGGLSNAYYPPADRGFGLTMSRAGISLLYGSAGGLGSEFWPDIDRRLFHRHPKDTPSGLPLSQQPQK
jgi:hypothetical protein